LLSFDSRNPGDDIEEKSCSNLDEAEALRFSRCAAMLLMTANSAGYMAVSFPWLVVIMLYMDYCTFSLAFNGGCLKTYVY
jgi:hypothetical protein